MNDVAAYAIGRFPIRLAWYVRPGFFPVGLTQGRCYVEVTPRVIRVRFGWLFHQEVPRESVISASLTRVPWYCGPGVHYGPGGRLFVTGCYGTGVEFVLCEPEVVSFWWIRRRRFVVTVREPERLLAALAPTVQASA